MFVTVGDTATWYTLATFGSFLMESEILLRVRLFRIHVCVSWYLKFRQTFLQVDVWDYNRSAPLSSFEWGCERVITVWGLGFLRWLLPDLQRNRLSPASTLRNRPSWRLLLWTDLLGYMLKPEM